MTRPASKAFWKALTSAREEDRRKASKWTGKCASGRHGLDFEGQRCDICSKRTKRLEKSKPGRPTRAAMSASVRFELRLTVDEANRWQAAADRQGLSLAELVRESVETCIARGSSR